MKGYACSMETSDLGNAKVQWDGKTLHLEVGNFCREIPFVKNIPLTGTLRARDRLWPQRDLAPTPLFALPGISLKEPAIGVKICPHRPFAGALESLRAEVCFTEGPVFLRWCLDLWPDHEAMRSQVFVKAPPMSNQASKPSSPDMPLETDPVKLAQNKSGDQSACLALGVPHLKVTAVKLYDRTDEHDHLVEENLRHCHPIRWEAFDGNLFLLDDYLSGDGLLLVKEGPTVEGALNRRGSDLSLLATGHALLQGTGLDPTTYDPNAEQAADAWTLLAGKTETLRPAHRALQQARSRVTGRPLRFAMSNTWGDRNRDSALNQAFMLQEIEAAAGGGANMVMIDDGWQTGRTSNSALSKTGVWENYWATQPDFWKPDTGKFPGGLKPLVEACQRRGMTLSLWYSPDSSGHFANWEKDSATLLDLHRTHQISAFKLDGIHVRSKLGESRVARLFETLHRAAPGLVLCLDVTAQIRPGYLPWPQHVHLFVENRYTDWGNYHPHRTLRNVWQLGRWLPLERLQIEILNPHRNPDKYRGDALAPGLYDMAYVAATAILAQPLLWMEVQHLAPGDQKALRGVTDAFAPVMSQGPVVEPMGPMPDGTTWTGFRISTGKEDFVLVFREWNQVSSWVIPGTAGRQGAVLFSNRMGSSPLVKATPEGVLITLDEPASFALCRLT